MIRKVLFGFLWFVAFYFAGGMLAGGIAGAAHGASRPDERLSRQAAMEIGAHAARQFLPVIVGGAVALSIAGSAFGLLPGTRSRRVG